MRFRSARPPHARTRALAITGMTFAFAAFALVSAGCTRSAGEPISAAPRPHGSSDEGRFRAQAASIGAWSDRRPSGTTIHHDMLVIERPAEASEFNSERSGFLVTTTNRALDGRIREVLEGRTPVRRGTRANFALPQSAPVRIERVLPNGRRELVAETRVSFLEIER